MQDFPEFPLCRDRRHRSRRELCCLQEAIDYIRSGNGPAFVHGHVIRPYSHSLSDDEKLYRSAAEREAEVVRDPLTSFQMRLLREGILDAEGIDDWSRKSMRKCGTPATSALRPPCLSPAPTSSSSIRQISIPQRRHFETEAVHPTPPIGAASPEQPWPTSSTAA